MKIKNQLIISIVVFSIVLTLIAASIANTELQVTQLNAQEAISGNIERGASNLNSVSINFFLYQEDLQLSQWQSEVSTLNGNVSNLRVNSPQQQMLEQNISYDLQKLNASFDVVVSYLQSASRNVSVRIDPAFQSRWTSMTVQVQSLGLDASQLSRSLSDQARQINDSNILLIASLVGTFAAFLVTAYLMIFRRTLKSVAKLQDGINTVSSGNLDYVIETKRNDEISDLSSSFNQMTTNRKLAEEKLRTASLYSRSLIEASLDPLVTISSEGKITDVNKSTEEVTGYSREQLIGTDFSDYFTEPEKARAGYSKVFTEGFVTDYPLAIKHKSGKITDVLYNATVYKNDEGKVQGVFAAARDVTERKRTEEALHKQAALIDLSPDGIMVKKLDDTITFWSQGAEKLYGWSKDEVIGQRTLDLFKTTFPDSLDNIVNQLKKVGKWSGELSHHKKNGEKIVVQSSWLATFDENGEVTEILESNVDVTERKEAEEKLRVASLYSRSLIEASVDPLATINADGKITDVNKSTEEVTGYSREQLIGSDFSDYFTEPDKARVGYKKVFTEGYVRDYPLAIRHQSGKITDVLYNATVYRNEDGVIQGVFAAARDVTDRKIAEQKLLAASLYSRSLIEASLDPLVTISKDGKITDVNKATEDVTGRTREELIDSDFSDYFTEPQEARAGYQKVFTEGLVKDYPLAIKHKSGRIIDVLYNASIYRNQNGEIQGIFAAARDVTERKKAEENVRAASLYSRSLIEASLDPLVTISAEGKITDVNESTEDVTGFSREQLIGSDFSDYFTEPEKARAGYKQVFTEGLVKDYPLAIRHKSGKITDVLYNATLYRNPQGDIQGVFAAARDVTERNAMESEIKQTMEKLKQSNAELEQFAYVASHDLQEPLRMVASYVQLLERRYKGKLDKDADEFIGYAVDGANRMRGLIDDLLTYSRVARLGKPFEPTNIESTLDIVLLNLQASIKENNATVTHDKLPVVMADGGQLVQLLQNLIGNAIKFHGKKPPHVHVSAQDKGNEYVFSVRDNGIGIAPEYYDRLFKIFQRLHTREEYPGSGIGLAVCKRIVERHGGRIWIESQVGKGSTIYFTLNKQKGVDKNK